MADVNRGIKDHGGVLTYVFGLTSVALTIAASVVVLFVILEDQKLETRTWSLIFLLGGLGFLFALISFWIIRIPAPNPTQNSGSDAVLDEIAKWHKSAALLSKGVQILQHDPISLQVSLIERSSIEDQRMRDSVASAVALVKSINDTNLRATKDSICSHLFHTPLNKPSLEFAARSVTFLRQQLQGEEQDLADDALDQLKNAASALSKRDSLEHAIESLRVG